jgi:hypothetical protein
LFSSLSSPLFPHRYHKMDVWAYRPFTFARMLECGRVKVVVAVVTRYRMNYEILYDNAEFSPSRVQTPSLCHANPCIMLCHDCLHRAHFSDSPQHISVRFCHQVSLPHKNEGLFLLGRIFGPCDASASEVNLARLV